MKGAGSRVERLSRAFGRRSLQSSGAHLALGQLKRLQERNRLGAFLLRPARAYRVALPAGSDRPAEAMAAELASQSQFGFPSSPSSSMGRSREKWRVSAPNPVRNRSLAEGVRRGPLRPELVRQTSSRPGTTDRSRHEPRQNRMEAVLTKVNKQVRAGGVHRVPEEPVHGSAAHPAEAVRRYGMQPARVTMQPIVLPENSIGAALRRQMTGGREASSPRPRGEAGWSNSGARRGTPVPPPSHAVQGSETMTGRLRGSYSGGAGAAFQAPTADGSESGSSSSDTLLLSGEIVIDGRHIGQIVARRQAHQLNGAPSTSSAVNLRGTPLSPGLTIPLP